jgi:hypothetical protein
MQLADEDSSSVVLCRVCLTQKPSGTEGSSNFLTVSEKIDNQPISELIENLTGISVMFCFGSMFKIHLQTPPFDSSSSHTEAPQMKCAGVAPKMSTTPWPQKIDV